MVEEELPSDGEPLMHHSQEEYVYDDGGAWAVSEATVATEPDSGQAESHVVLDRRLGTLGRPIFCSRIPCVKKPSSTMTTWHASQGKLQLYLSVILERSAKT